MNLRGHTAIINCIRFDDSTGSDSLRLVTGGQDKRLGLLSILCRQLVLSFQSSFTCLSLPCKDLLALFFYRVHVYDVRQPLPTMQLIGHSDAVLSVQMDEWKVVSGR